MEAPWTCCQTWFVRIGKDYQENKCFTIFTLFYFTEATWFKESDWSEVDNKNHRWKKLIRAISSSSAALVHVACMQFHRFYEFFSPFYKFAAYFLFYFSTLISSIILSAFHLSAFPSCFNFHDLISVSFDLEPAAEREKHKNSHQSLADLPSRTFFSSNGGIIRLMLRTLLLKTLWAD